jgi:hypothetical protein
MTASNVIRFPLKRRRRPASTARPSLDAMVAHLPDEKVAHLAGTVRLMLEFMRLVRKHHRGQKKAAGSPFPDGAA